MSRLDRPIVPDRRKYRPGCEGLEARDLPSAAPTAVTVHLVPTPAPSYAAPDTPVKTVYHEPLVPVGGAAQLASFERLIQSSYVQDPLLQAADTIPNSSAPTNQIQPYTPTLAELEREQFIAKYEGRYTISAGRFSDQAYTIHTVTRSGGSNQFTRGLAQLFLAEPNAVPATAGYTPLVQGVGSNFPYSTLNSGDNLITAITGTAGVGQAVGNYTLPTQLTWYVDTTSTTGYATPTNAIEGGGSLQMYWIPDKTPAPGTLGSGRVIWLYQGLDANPGILNGIDPEISS